MAIKKQQIELKTKLPGRKSLSEDKVTEKGQSEKFGLIKDTKYHPRSYRWRDSDIQMIEQLVSRVNDVSNRKIDATKILRGALVLASNAKTEKLLNAIVRAEVDSIM